jgi:CAAX prenyl protease-like protein
MLVRVAPFFIFVGLTFLQGKLGASSAYWIYLGKILVGAWFLWLMRPMVAEMRWAWSWEALVAGILVFVIWVGLDPYYPKLSTGGTTWNPHNHMGAGAAWFFVGVRIVGSTLVVPPLEEVFYRSFVYRYLAKPEFLTVPLGMFAWIPFLGTSLVFGLAHSEWLAGILCGLIYQGLVCRKKRLGDAMTAHAITNLLLGLWVIWKGAWNFW